MQKKLVEQLLTKYPDDLFVHLRYESISRGRTEAERQALIEPYQKLAETHPGDIAYQFFLYAQALLDKDTPRAIELAQQIVNKHPGFARAHLLLANIYSGENFKTVRKCGRNSTHFLRAVRKHWIPPLFPWPSDTAARIWQRSWFPN